LPLWFQQAGRPGAASGGPAPRPEGFGRPLPSAPLPLLSPLPSPRQGLHFDYELFNSSSIRIRYWSWNYRGCWHQTCPPIDSQWVLLLRLHSKPGTTLRQPPCRYFLSLPRAATRIGQFSCLLHSLELVAVSQAPSPESNPNSPLPVVGMVGRYPTIYLIGQTVILAAGANPRPKPRCPVQTPTASSTRPPRRTEGVAAEFPGLSSQLLSSSSRGLDWLPPARRPRDQSPSQKY